MEDVEILVEDSLGLVVGSSFVVRLAGVDWAFEEGSLLVVGY